MQGLPILALNLLEGPQETVPFDKLDRLGWLLFVTGLVVESVADQQKARFLHRFPKRETRPFIEDGLWSLSRHPNYFGESLGKAGRSVLYLLIRMS